MTTIAAEHAQEIADAIAEHGREMTLRQLSTGAYDPATGDAPQASADYPAFGIVTRYRNREIDGVRILAKDRRIVLQAKGLNATPAPGDRVIVGAETFTIADDGVKTYEAGGEPFAYVLQARL